MFDRVPCLFPEIDRDARFRFTLIDLIKLREKVPYIPNFRWPGKRKIKSIFDAFRVANRLQPNPLISAQMLHERNLEAYFLYVPHFQQRCISLSRSLTNDAFYDVRHKPLNDAQAFLAGIASTNAIDSAILNIHNGIALDSSWRRLNHNGCPLTLVTTTNERQRMVPSDSLCWLQCINETVKLTCVSLQSLLL